MKRRFFTAVMAVLTVSVVFTGFALFFTACDNFNRALSPYIEESTGMARSYDDYFTTPYFEMSDGIYAGVIAIPPDELTRINIDVQNPQNYDLELSLTGEGSELAQVSLEIENIDNNKKWTAVVTIENPVRSTDDFFDLTLHIAANGRPMDERNLPKMQARYLNAEISSLAVVPKDGPKANQSQQISITPPPPYSLLS